MANLIEQINEELLFGGGIRWPLRRLGAVDWKVALSLPIGLIVTAVLVLVSVVEGSRSSWISLGSDRVVFFVVPVVWLVGLLVQAVVAQLWLSREAALASRSEPSGFERNGLRPSVTLTIGGVWCSSFANAARGLMLWSMLLMVLASLPVACYLIERFALQTSWQLDVASLNRLVVPSGWVWLMQGFWQALPLPQSFGRVGWSFLVGLVFGNPASPAASTRLIRVLVALAGVIGLGLGLTGLLVSSWVEMPEVRVWPSLAGVSLLALWLWLSAWGSDLAIGQEQMHQASQLGLLRHQFDPRVRWHHYQEARLQRRREKGLREAQLRERREASEASRADEILERLHQQGIDALSEDDRQILQRVSDSIRQQRSKEDSL